MVINKKQKGKFERVMNKIYETIVKKEDYEYVNMMTLGRSLKAALDYHWRPRHWY